MKVLLMHPERDFVDGLELPLAEDAVTQDLELVAVWEAMAADDAFVFDVSRWALLGSATDPDTISYRQEVVRDCLQNPELVRELYELTGEALRAQKRIWSSLLRDSPSQVLRTSIEKLGALLDYLRALRAFAEEHAAEFSSRAFVRLFATVGEQLDDDYLASVEAHLNELRFRRGLLFSVVLGDGNRGRDYVLRVQREQGFLERLGFGPRSGYGFTIADRDQAGFRALGQIQDKGLNVVANALGQSADHVVGFFTTLRTELAFYVGCLNLHERLAAKEEPTCFPTPLAPGNQGLSARQLYDPALSLTIDQRAVGNDVDADGRSLVMITGANQGGKSTFLRSVGIAQLMMQCGMFVCARSFRADVCAGVFTHYKREEDASMTSGKLDEELSRMSAIADAIRPGCILLCNESFSATNEREGSEIARQVVRAMLDSGVRVLYVTHLFELAHGFHAEASEHALFLRAERHPDGGRTFRVVEGEPLPTSYGVDSYRRIFGDDQESMPALAEGRGQ
jgi:MutS domain V